MTEDIRRELRKKNAESAQSSDFSDFAFRRIAELEGEVKRLREALAPFASIPPSDSSPYHYWVVNGSPQKSHFTIDDLRRAAALMEKKKP